MRLLPAGDTAVVVEFGDRVDRALSSEVLHLARQLRAAVWVSQRRWNLVLNNGVEIWLPEEDAVAALQQLAKLDAQYNLLSREFGVVDLRLPDKLYLRKRNSGEVTPGPA